MIVAATGHRPNKLGGYDIYVADRLRILAERWLRLHRPEHVVVGMAQGWDTAVALACVNLNTPFIAAVPFPRQHRMWPENARRIFEQLLAQAESVHVVSPGPYTVQKMHARNKWMVDNSEYILALWNGVEDGGTYHCIEYAHKQKRTVENLWAEWKENGPDSRRQRS